MPAVPTPAVPTTARLAVHLASQPEGWTADDLAAFPDDGLRHELVDGVLLVSASPSEQHQIALANLHLLLALACPSHLRVFFAPFDVRFTPRRQLQPDLVVVPKDPDAVDRTPLLAVEVLSPATGATDRTLKRQVYQDGGVPSYWLLDPVELELTVLELRDGRYVEAAAGDTAYDAARPFAVRVVPAELAR